MLSLCQPYAPTITCLCDETASVLRCFLTTEEGERERGTPHNEDTGPSSSKDTSQNEDNSVLCSKIADLKTEILLAVAIVIMVIVILFW